MSLMRRIFDRRNVLGFAVLIIGFIGLFGFPNRLGLNENQIIIGLLMFIVTETFITNIGFLTVIDEKLDTLRPQASLDSYFKFRREKKQIHELLTQAHFMRVSGISLGVFFSDNFNLLKEAAKRGAKLEFILAHPNAQYLNEIDMMDGDEFRKSIEIILHRLKTLDPAIRERIEVRFTPTVIYDSIIHVRWREILEEVNYIAVELYTFGAEGATIQSLELDQRTSPRMFAYYQQAEERRWEQAIPLDNLVLP